MAGRRIVIEFLGKDRSLGRSSRKAGDDVEALGRRMRNVGKVAAFALAGGTALAARSLYKMGKSAAEDEAAQRRLATALKNSAKATKGQVKSTEDWISKQGVALGVTDDELRPALGRFVAVTHDVAKSQQLASLAMDISAGSGKSLETVSGALAKAQNGNVSGLSRLGIATKDASGKTLSLDKVMRNAAKTFKGQAATSADSLDGKMRRLKLILDEAKESIGAKLIPVATRFADFIMTKVVPAVSRFVKQMQDGEGAGGKVKSVLDKLGQTVSTVFGFIKENAATIATFVGVLGTLVAIVKTATFVQGLFNAVMLANPVTLTVVAIAALAAGLVYAYKKSETFRTIVDGLWNNALKPFASWLGDVLPGVLRTVGGAFLTMAEVNVKVFHFLLDVVLNVFGAIVNGAAKAFGWVPGIGGKIKGAAKAFNGFKDTVDGALDAVEDKIKDTRGALDELGRKKPKPKVDLDSGPSLRAAERINNKLIALDKKRARPKVDLVGSGTVLGQIKAVGDRIRALNGKSARVRIGENAKGTDNWRGGLTMVGEEGPELINLQRGAQVIPNDRLVGLGSGRGGVSMGGGTSINIHVSGAMDPTAVATQIRQMLLKLKRESGVELGLS